MLPLSSGIGKFWRYRLPTGKSNPGLHSPASGSLPASQPPILSPNLALLTPKLTQPDTIRLCDGTVQSFPPLPASFRSPARPCPAASLGRSLAPRRQPPPLTRRGWWSPAPARAARATRPSGSSTTPPATTRAAAPAARAAPPRLHPHARRSR